MRGSRPVASAALGLSAGLLAPALAHSQSRSYTPAQEAPGPAQSRVLAEYGLDPTAHIAARIPLETARDNMVAGDCAAALEALRVAQTFVHAPTIEFALATCLEKLNLLLEAEQALRDIDSIPAAPDEAPSWRAARASAHGRAESLRARVPVVEVVLPPSFAGLALTVTIDGIAAEPSAGTNDYRVNPGRHHLRVEVPGHAIAEGVFEVAEGARLPAHLNVPGPKAGISTDGPRSYARPWLRPGVVVIPHLGLQLYGSTKATTTGALEGSGLDDMEKGDDSLWLALGLDVLYAPVTRLRFGAGVVVLPQLSDGARPEWGTELAPVAIVETVMPAGEWAWALRLEGGPQFLLGGRTLEAAGRQDDLYCASVREQGLQCSNGVRRVGWTAAGGVAFLMPAGAARFRLDFTFQYLSVKMVSLEASGDAGRFSHDTTLTGKQVLACAGVEF